MNVILFRILIACLCILFIFFTGCTVQTSGTLETGMTIYR